MQAFRVDDMSCGHCASSITQAIKAIDKDARVTVDLARHLVMVEAADADAQDLSDAIAEAGYTPMPVTAPAMAAKPARTCGGCGCCG